MNINDTIQHPVTLVFRGGRMEHHTHTFKVVDIHEENGIQMAYGELIESTDPNEKALGRVKPLGRA